MKHIVIVYIKVIEKSLIAWGDLTTKKNHYHDKNFVWGVMTYCYIFIAFLLDITDRTQIVNNLQ